MPAMIPTKSYQIHLAASFYFLICHAVNRSIQLSRSVRMAELKDAEKTTESTPESPSSSRDNNDTDDMEPIGPVQTNNARPACFNTTLQEVLFVFTATMAIAMGALLTGSITVVSSYIGRDLDMTTAEITWITSASTLSSGSFLLFFGRIADLFGTLITAHYR